MDSVTYYGGQYFGTRGPSSKCPLIPKVICRKDMIFQKLLVHYNIRSMNRGITQISKYVYSKSHFAHRGALCSDC